MRCCALCSRRDARLWVGRPRVHAVDTQEPEHLPSRHPESQVPDSHLPRRAEPELLPQSPDHHRVRLRRLRRRNPRSLSCDILVLPLLRQPGLQISRSAMLRAAQPLRKRNRIRSPGGRRARRVRYSAGERV